MDYSVREQNKCKYAFFIGRAHIDVDAHDDINYCADIIQY